VKRNEEDKGKDHLPLLRKVNLQKNVNFESTWPAWSAWSTCSTSSTSSIQLQNFPLIVSVYETTSTSTSSSPSFLPKMHPNVHSTHLTSTKGMVQLSDPQYLPIMCISVLNESEKIIFRKAYQLHQKFNRLLNCEWNQNTNKTNHYLKYLSPLLQKLMFRLIIYIFLLPKSNIGTSRFYNYITSDLIVKIFNKTLEDLQLFSVAFNNRIRETIYTDTNTSFVSLFK
jgi:hypothetical protein